MTVREELIAELKRLQAETGRTPTKALMVGKGKFDPEQYREQFGSWEEALRVAGFDPEARDRERYDTLSQLDQESQTKIQMLLESNEYELFFRGQLLAEVNRLAVELDEAPSITDLRKYGRYSDNNYFKYFGSWSEAIKEIGVSPNEVPTRISDLELLAELRRVAEAIDAKPRTKDIRERGKYSVQTYYSHFESWDAACEQAGILSTTGG
ncbi:homing endonuclease associated repeat-containing protein [Haloarcula nitratireducens]|uniref:Uncharacterized protein n=1 Tax=Haloarcula nitratireducens TaxID=2487749 RepID=A0AAW4PIR3_9EURY|nr:hypothetical protein [Halomicroarcula nitratireducens]MBX0297438.1 hypothetical protein [Halomicroarcula nitratireducens]